MDDSVVRRLARDWTTNQLRRIDGGPDYYTEPTEQTVKRRPLPDVSVERASRAPGHMPLPRALLMIRDGYSLAHVSRVSGWGEWWLIEAATSPQR